MTLSRTLAACLTVAAIAAPSAWSATPPPDRQTPAAHQDLRSPDARDAAMHPRGPGHAINAPGATAVESQSVPSLPGPPTWPVNPRPVTTPVAAQPVSDGDGLDWTTIGNGIAGSLLAIGALALVANRRQVPRVRASV